MEYLVEVDPAHVRRLLVGVPGEVITKQDAVLASLILNVSKTIFTHIQLLMQENGIVFAEWQEDDGGEIDPALSNPRVTE